MVGGWIASYVFIFIFWFRCCCCCCMLLLLPTTSVLKRREMLARSEGLARVRVCPHRGRRAALARWQGRVSAVSHTRPNHSALELVFCDSPPLGLVSSRGLSAAIALSREGLARVWIRLRRGRRSALASWQGRVSAVSYMRRTSSHEPRYQYTAICYCCWAFCRTCFSQTT